MLVSAALVWRVVVLEILGILGKLQTKGPAFLDWRFVHRFIEAGRLAEDDRMTLVGDPDVGPVSVSRLLESSYLTARAALLQDGVALTDPIPKAFRPGFSRPDCRQVEHAPAPSTSQISIVDGSGNALAMTTTLNVNFGSWITLGGFFLNDAMTNFAIPADGGCPANFPSGGKRPETSMAPVIGMDTNGNLTLVCGSAGAGEIVDYVAQAVVEILAGRPPAAALDDGHVSTAKASYPESVGIVELEQGRAIAQLGPQLRALGHKVRVVPLQSGLAVLVRKQGRWEGAADPRRDGIFASSR